MQFLFTTVEQLLASSEEREQVVGLLSQQGCELLTGIESELCDYLKDIKPTVKVIIESDYIDKIYRDCYYQLFAKKLHNIPRNCIRLSFFDTTSTLEELEHDLAGHTSDYRGFLVLRPLSGHACIGRNVLNPSVKSFEGELINICQASIPASCMGVKMDAVGFPHSAQDGELMTCAETTIWAMLEYFGNRYANYKPILPVEILRSLEGKVCERMTPSSGLNYQQVSEILCEEGLGAKLYDWTHPMFKQIFTCYVESGLPLAVCVDNTYNGIGEVTHSVVCVGRKEIDLGGCRLASRDADGKTIYLWNDSINEFVFNDDNCSCCRVVPFEKTGNYYSDLDDGGKDGWDDMKITNFIVPLPEKVYMDAEIAIKVSEYYATNILEVPDESVIRTFLVSNRTYKDYVMHNEDLSKDVKEFLVGLSMPKFVWVTEISTEESFRNKKTNSLILLDATTISAEGSDRSVILAVNGDEMFYYTDEYGDLEYVDNIFPNEFESFTGNLK